MKNNNKMNEDTSVSPWLNWRGLGHWNYYFLIKLALLWYGYLNFHALTNLIFMAFLLMPLPSQKLHKWRNWVAIPIGIALFYHDTWLPGIESIMSQGSLLTGFSASYLWELINRFINWQWVGAAFALWIAYLFIAQWVRVTVFVVPALLWVNVLNIAGPSFSLTPEANTASAAPQTTAPAASASSGTAPADSGPPNNENLNAYLQQFYQQEQGRRTAFPTSLPEDAQPFDVLIINICSLSLSDMEVAKVAQHPLWSKFDIVFDQFNSATSYSGPASIRLLRASCGQPSHKGLYQPAENQCYLFSNLAQLGFKEELIMDHAGVFGDYLKELREYGGMQAPLMSQAGLSHELASFDGEPVFNDLAVLNRWLEGREKDTEAARSATFFNLIPLHDGNRNVGSNSVAPYPPRAKALFDQLDTFLDQLEKSGRKVLVVVVPEHGAALAGDKMQMSGLRDIPSPSITHIPVGVKLIGIKAPHQASALKIETPSSYIAISDLISRLVDGKSFIAPTIDWAALTKDLPNTPAVSENSGAVVLKYQDKPYIQLNGGDWVPYPQ